jgi:lysophospholipase L1-like esterase
MNSLIRDILKKRNSLIYVFFSITFFIYILIKKYFYFKNLEDQYYNSYLILAFTMILLSFLSFKIQDKYLTIVNYNLFVILITIYVFQYFFFYKNNNIPLAKIKEYKAMTGNNYDVRSKYQIYEDLKKIDKDVAVSIHPKYYLNKSNLTFFPLSGLSNKFTIYCNENGYYNTYKSDKHGFNNPNKIWEEKFLDYVFVGDSYVHGACVNYQDTFIGNIQRLSKKKILGLGYGGNGLLSSYALLREYTLDKEFNSLVLFYFEENDIEDTEREFKHPILKKYLSDQFFSQNLINRQLEIDQLSQNTLNSEFKIAKKNSISRLIRLNDVRDLIFNIFKKKNIIKSHKINRNYKNFEKIINKIQEFSNSKNAQLIFVYIPQYARYSQNNLYYSKFIDDSEIILDILKKKNVKIINLIEKIKKKSLTVEELYPFGDYGHFNEKAYSIISNEIYLALEN